MIGASFEAIHRGENRELFNDIVRKVGGEVARSFICHSMPDVEAAVESLGFPVVIRPSFTMGGLGSGIAYDSRTCTASPAPASRPPRPPRSSSRSPSSAGRSTSWR